MNGLIATPPRRGHDPSLSPLTPKPTPSSSVHQSTTPTTVDSALAAHANAPNPAIAALEQSVSERNVLSSQNAQLWKLLEKARAAYSQSSKDLERVRGERDAYKAKVQELGHSTEAIIRSLREKEKALRPPASNSSLRPPDRSHGSSSSRTPTKPRSSNDPKMTLGAVTEPVGPVAYQRSAAPLVTISQTQPHEPSSTPEHPPEPSVHVHPSIPLTLQGPSRTHSLNPRLHAESSNDIHSIHIPRTNNQAESLSPSASVSPGGISPQEYSSMASVDPVFSNASLTLDPHSQMTSHESALSLPDEAKRFISTTEESPLPSPRMAEHVHSSDQSRAESPSSSLAAHQSLDKSSVRRELSDGEFLDMEDEDSSFYESVLERSAVSSSPADLEGKPSLEENNGRHHGASVEDFPLPPSHLSSTNPAMPPESQPIPSIQQTPQSPSVPPSLHPGFVHHASSATLSDDNSVTYTEGASSTGLSSPHLKIDKHTSVLSAISSIMPSQSSNAKFRALPLLPHDLPRTRITVINSTIRPNDRGKDVLSFTVFVNAGSGKEPWTIEKTYGDVLGLDQRIRARVGKTVGKKMVNLPDGKLWKDHAPSRVDQRKAIMEQYLQGVVNLPVKNNDEIVAFLTSDVLRETNKPVSREGYKEGYLTKRGKNFGGWKTRFFVVQGPVLEYYESRGGTHLGSIPITGAQIGRQQKPVDRRESDEENEYRHAFLVIEPRKGAVSSHRHVLCAESDEERDQWVDILVRYVTGSYNDEPVPSNSAGQPQPSINTSINPSVVAGAPRSSTSSNAPVDIAGVHRDRKQVGRAMSKDDIAVGPAVPISQLSQDPANAKLFQSTPNFDEASIHGSPLKGNDSPMDRQIPSFSDTQTAKRLLEKGHPASAPASESPLSSSLPTSSPLEQATGADLLVAAPRANSELGHYPDLADPRSGRGRPPQPSPERPRHRHPSRTNYQPTLDTVKSTPSTPHAPDRAPSPDAGQSTPRPDANGKVKISGPMNGTPIPAGYKFGAKEATPEPPASERREKAKSRMFWNFGRPGAADKSQAVPHVPRNVFGVSIDESLEIAQIASLPAIVFRCIQYLERKKAEQEEGIYRLSGSSAVIKSLKDRFNNEGDVDLLASDEYWDPHAIAGLLKSFFRELPSSILTRDLHMRFLKVIDLVDQKDRVKELTRLVSALPLANYSLLRALTAHLIKIVDNANLNKMTMRNVGIVFSPTLGIPAGVLSLMLAEFNRVFNIDDDADADIQFLHDEESSRGEMVTTEHEHPSDISRRNSHQYSEAAADQLLGLSGRSLSAPDDTHLEDGDDFSVHDESGTDATDNEIPSDTGPTADISEADGLATIRSRASNVAASRGLNITTSTNASRRHSRMMGLPVSPRPPASPHPPHSGTGGDSASTRSPSHAAR